MKWWPSPVPAGGIKTFFLTRRFDLSEWVKSTGVINNINSGSSHSSVPLRRVSVTVKQHEQCQDPEA